MNSFFLKQQLLKQRIVPIKTYALYKNMKFLCKNRKTLRKKVLNKVLNIVLQENDFSSR